EIAGPAAHPTQKGVTQGASDRKPFDSLRAPLRRDLRTRAPPDLFGVGAEERPVQLVAEPVDEEVFQRDLWTPRSEQPMAVGGPDPQHACDPEFRQRVQAQLKRVVVDFPPEQNA